jgi:Sulfatase
MGSTRPDASTWTPCGASRRPRLTTVRDRLRRLSVAVVLAACATVVASCSGASSPDSRAAARAPSHPPVVMLVFDEFSTNSLLDERGRIDEVRYPHFAALGREANWFPLATASLDETGRAMRALFTGRTTWRYAKPTYSENPRNIFTLLGRRYHVDASEEVSSMCPRRLCPGVRGQNQKTILRKLRAGRPERFERWLDSLRARARPTFYFEHALLPHGPWVYLPSGRRYAEGRTQKPLSWRVRHFNRWQVNLAYQRHLLQVGFTDRLLGRALERLRATGLYDRSLIVVTADNGESFGRLGNGHEISRRNAADIALTPLFVKLPFQREGRIVGRPARIIDVLPTIAHLAHVRPRWPTEGRSLFGRGARRIPSSALLVKRSGQRMRLSRGGLRRKAAGSLRLKLRLFGSRDASPGLFGIGPNRAMVGTPLARWERVPPAGTRAVLDEGSRNPEVRPGASLLPINVTGSLTGGAYRKRVDIAIAVGDTIATTATTFAARRGGRQLLSALVPESALQEGTNRVRIFAIERGQPAPRLRPLTP